MKIEFKSLPNNDFTYMGISADEVKSIIIDDIPVGIVYLTDLVGEEMFVEWLELLDAFHGKRLLRPIMKALLAEYGPLRFETNDESLIKKYKSIGALEYNYDEEFKTTEFIYKGGNMLAVIHKADSLERFSFYASDIKWIYEKMLELTDNDMEIADEAACWCGDAPLGAIYDFREGHIEITEG